MIYGYARVSTKGQAKDGNSLEAQERTLRDNGASSIYYDAFTGAKVDRPELNKLVGMLQEGDILVVTKLDRLGRSLSKTSELITELIERGVTINILNLGVLSNSSVNTLMRNILLAFAQFERDMIVERTTEGKEICRETKPDWRDGRKQVDIPDFEKYFEKQKAGEMSVTECCKALGISRGTWYNRVAEAEA
ncbi:MAG: recombinase family protein [Paludibacteraceae bacterium]|nr:recombinase family protein [Paludibacteraceae bacterium]